MTMTLDAPTEAPDLVVIEEHQHDVPLVCTYTRYTSTGARRTAPCSATAQWEALCLGCGFVFRRCEAHYQYEQTLAAGARQYTGQVMVCFQCDAPVYIDQFVRIPA